ncbi:hypothetical protein ACRAWD_15885 [Caulobacter segnis]
MSDSPPQGYVTVVLDLQLAPSRWADALSNARAPRHHALVIVTRARSRATRVKIDGLDAGA